MALSPGTQLGPYEISVPLGAGGMGEVYRARDTRLERSVAIKILPAHLSSDPIRIFAVDSAQGVRGALAAILSDISRM